MNELVLSLPEAEALGLYRFIHRTPQGQDLYCDTYRQLQAHFFKILTVDEITDLLEKSE